MPHSQVQEQTDDSALAMDLEEIEGIVRHELDQAVDYIDDYVSPERAEATRYYKGEPFGNEEEGRSQVVSRDVQETTQALLPSLLRVFWGTDRPVEFVPERPEDVPVAEQMTDYVNYVIAQDNDGFQIFHGWFKDALVRRTGIVKWWWDDSTEVTFHNFTDLDEQGLSALMQDEAAEIEELVSYPAPGAEQQVQQALEQGVIIEPPVLYNARVRRTRSADRARVMGVPPDEFLISREARSIDSARLVAHRPRITAGELIAMGFDEEIVGDHAGDDDRLDNAEELERHPFDELEDTANPSAKIVPFYEVYIRLDTDGDGIPELHKVSMIGKELADIEPADEIPFAILVPDPEPHTWSGESVADKVMDIQRIKSAIQRGTLDSLALSIHPRTEAVESQVNIDDLLNPEVGAIIRTRQPGMVREVRHSFVGQDAFPVLDYFDQVRETRTGVSRASKGLDSKALQSSTALAVSETFSAKREAAELIARIFAETGVKRLFKGLLRLIVRNQDRERMVRLRNEYVPVDPRSWNADMDVTVNVALGSGSDEEKLQRMLALSQKQEQILQTAGPNNPIVTLGQYANTLSEIVKLSGFKDPSRFINQLPADFQPEPPEPEPDPNLIIAQAEAQKVQIDQQKLQLDQQKMLLEDERERDKTDMEVAVDVAKINAEFDAKVTVESIRALAKGPQTDVR